MEIVKKLYPYDKNDRELQQEGQFVELEVRKLTRNIFRNIRKAAKEGTLKLHVGPRTTLHDQYDKAQEIRRVSKQKEEDLQVTIKSASASPAKRQRVNMFDKTSTDTQIKI